MGRRVIVTRSADRADTLVDLLRRAGHEPVVVPLVTSETVSEDLDRLGALDPATFDWLVVASPTAAEVFLSVHRSVPPRIAAIGAATASRLRAAGHRVDLVPSVQRADALVAAFPAGPGAVLVVQAVDGATTLVDGLRRSGWTVEAVRPYRTVTAPPAGAARALVDGAEVVMFASGSAARAWVDVFGGSTPPVVVAIGPQTAADASAVGIDVTVVADDHSPAGMVEALDRHLRCHP